LCARYRRLTRVAKPANVVTTAMLDYSASWRSAGPARPRGRAADAVCPPVFAMINRQQ